MPKDRELMDETLYVGIVKPTATGSTDWIVVAVAGTLTEAGELTEKWIKEQGHPGIHYHRAVSFVYREYISKYLVDAVEPKTRTKSNNYVQLEIPGLDLQG